MVTLARLFLETILIGLLVSSAHTASIGVDKRGLYDWAGSGFSLVNRMVWSKEANRLACEKYGFVDPDFRTGGSVSDHNFILGAGIQAFNTLAPSEVLKASCIDEGFYHPDRVDTNTSAAGNTKPEEEHEKKPTQSETVTETDKTGQGKEIVAPVPPMELEKKEPEPQIQPQIEPAGTETRMEGNLEAEAGESETNIKQNSEANPLPATPVQEPVKSFNVAGNKGSVVEQEQLDPVSEANSEPNQEKPMVNGPRKIPVAIHHHDRKPVANGRGDANAVAGAIHNSPMVFEEGVAR